MLVNRDTVHSKKNISPETGEEIADIGFLPKFGTDLGSSSENITREKPMSAATSHVTISRNWRGNC